MKKRFFKGTLLVLSLGILTGCSTYQNSDRTILKSANTETGEASLLTVRLEDSTLEVGEKTQVIVNVNFKTNGEFIYESSDTSIARVSETGEITALKAGEVVIKVIDRNDLTRSNSTSLKVVDDIDQKFKVTFLNYDDSLLYETVVEAGKEAEFKGKEPVRANSHSTIYKFNGWDKDISAINGDTIVRATYAESDFGDYFFEGVNGFYKLVGYSGTDEVLTIPTSFNGGIVNGIGERVLEGNTHVKKVIVPNGIEYIDNYAFAENDYIEEAEISGSVLTFGSHMFYRCDALKKVAFHEGVVEIPTHCFNQATAIEEVAMPSTLKRVGDYAFFMSGLAKIELPASVTSIGTTAFSSCPNLTEVIINGNIETKETDTSWFSSCPLLTKVEFKGTVESFEMACFLGCTSLTEISIPDSVVTLGARCFSDCENLATIWLGENTSNFQEDCFQGTPALENGGIKLKETDKKHNIVNGILYSDEGKTVSYIMDATKVPEALNFASMGSGVTKIGDYAFYENENVKSIDLTGVTSVGVSAFDSCENIVQDLVIPSSVTSIGASSFAYLGITSLKLETTLDGIIPEECFRNCRSLVSARIPSGITRLGYGAFGWCNNNFVECYLPLTVTYLEEYAFQMDNKLVVKYEGTEEDWKKITIENGNAGKFTVEYSIPQTDTSETPAE